MSAEDERAYLQVLLARQDRRGELGVSPWRVPDLVTGMHERGMKKEVQGERMENKEICSGQGESEGKGRSRYKKRDKLYSFIKKTVVPYPRLG